MRDLTITDSTAFGCGSVRGLLGFGRDNVEPEEIIAFKVEDKREFIWIEHTNFLSYRGRYDCQGTSYEVFSNYKWTLHDLIHPRTQSFLGYELWSDDVFSHPSPILVKLLSGILNAFAFLASQDLCHGTFSSTDVVIVEYLDAKGSKTLCAKLVSALRRSQYVQDVQEDAKDLKKLFHFVFNKTSVDLPDPAKFTINHNGLIDPPDPAAEKITVPLREISDFFSLWQGGYIDGVIDLKKLAPKLLMHPLFFDDSLVMNFLRKLLDFIDTETNICQQNWPDHNAMILQYTISAKVSLVDPFYSPFRHPSNLGWSLCFSSRLKNVSQDAEANSRKDAVTFYESPYHLLKFYRNLGVHFLQHAIRGNVDVQGESDSEVVSLIRTYHPNLLIDAYSIYTRICEEKDANNNLVYIPVCPSYMGNFYKAR